MNDPEFGPRYKKINIGNHVFIGLRAIVLKGVTIGRGAVVGAGTIVLKHIGEYEIVAGVPAKKIGERATKLTYKPDWQPFFY
jgi:maltose O-acetyltransferase